jgi:GTPase
MESFLGLFNPEEDKQRGKDKWNDFENEGSGSSDYEGSGINEDQEHNNLYKEERLPPEPEQGNIEYKLKLVNPSSQRFEHLVTQMKWRLREGHGEAIYQIGTHNFIHLLY